MGFLILLSNKIFNAKTFFKSLIRCLPVCIAFEGNTQEIITNPPLGPLMCGGDWSLTLSGFYWSAFQDGLEFAIRNSVSVPIINPDAEELQEINHLFHAIIEKPKSKWEFGYKFGLGYMETCDGWDVDFFWTHFSPFSFTHAKTDIEDGQTFITLWSDFSPAQGETTFARDIEARWKLNLDVFDLELGRASWVGTQLSLRPFFGLRYSRIQQDYDLEHKGGSWSPRINPFQDPFTGKVFLENMYKGLGLRSGLETFWDLQCHWAFFGNVAGSILYGPFHIAQSEETQLIISPYTKSTILEFQETFRASRAVLDISFGLLWSQAICQSTCCITTKFSYETHLFFHQNQLWRIVQVGDTATTQNGVNVYNQCRGTLGMQGWTLMLVFTF